MNFVKLFSCSVLFLPICQTLQDFYDDLLQRKSREQRFLELAATQGVSETKASKKLKTGQVTCLRCVDGAPVLGCIFLIYRALPMISIYRSIEYAMLRHQSHLASSTSRNHELMKTRQDRNTTIFDLMVSRSCVAAGPTRAQL